MEFPSASGFALDKRDIIPNVSEFVGGLFECPKDNSACGNPNPPGDTDPEVLVKRATTVCTAIPAVMINCKYFPDRDQADPAGVNVHVKGMCTNINEYFTKHGLGSGPMGLRHDSALESRRRRAVCSAWTKENCTTINIQLTVGGATGDKPGKWVLVHIESLRLT